MIWEGRYYYISTRELRVCTYCKKVLEEEFNFMLVFLFIIYFKKETTFFFILSLFYCGDIYSLMFNNSVKSKKYYYDFVASLCFSMMLISILYMYYPNTYICFFYTLHKLFLDWKPFNANANMKFEV